MLHGWKVAVLPRAALLPGGNGSCGYLAWGRPRITARRAVSVRTL